MQEAQEEFGSARELDADLLRLVIEAVEIGLGETGLYLKPDKKAQVIVAIYELYRDEDEIDSQTVIRLIRLAA